MLTRQDKNRKVREILIIAAIFVLTLFFFHPLLHECGHVLGAWICRQHVEAVEIFPEYFTDVSIDRTAVNTYFLIAVMGWVLPLLISLWNPKTLREAAFILPLRVMVMITAIGEMVSIGEYTMGHADAKSDMTNVLIMTDANIWVVLSVMLVITAIAAALFAKGMISVITRIVEEKKKA